MKLVYIKKNKESIHGDDNIELFAYVLGFKTLSERFYHITYMTEECANNLALIAKIIIH